MFDHPPVLVGLVRRKARLGGTPLEEPCRGPSSFCGFFASSRFLLVRNTLLVRSGAPRLVELLLSPHVGAHLHSEVTELAQVDEFQWLLLSIVFGPILACGFLSCDVLSTWTMEALANFFVVFPLGGCGGMIAGYPCN